MAPSRIEARKDYEHGTRARYVLGRCRCQACRKANSDYQKSRARSIGYGKAPSVPAAPVRRHVRSLMSSPAPGVHHGLGWRAIARLAGVSASVVSTLVFGKRGRPTRRIKRENAERLLAVRPGPRALAPGALVDAAQTWRYLDEMVAFGIPKTRIARALGSRAKHPALQFGRHRLTAKKARAVENLHWELFKHAREFRRACRCPVPHHVLRWVESDGEQPRSQPARPHR